jgi:thioredoxin reductase
LKIYDLAIIGTGISGIMTAFNSKLSTIMLEKGHPLPKRKKDLINGWFGKGLYSIIKPEKSTKKALNFLNKLNMSRFDLASHFFNQSKADIIFDEEVVSIEKLNHFVIKTTNNIYYANRCVLASGENSAFFISSLNVDKLPIYLNIGIRVEVPTHKLTENFIDLNINSFVSDWEDLNIISVMPCCFDKISFKSNFLLSKTLYCSKEALEQIKVLNTLNDNKIVSQRLKDYLNGKSFMKHLSIFDFKDKLNFNFANYATIHYPEVHFNGTLITNNFQTSIPNLFGVGECANSKSFLSAMTDGMKLNKLLEES